MNNYQNALYALDGSNIKGIVHSFDQLVWELGNDGATGTEIEDHPAVKMYVAKLIEMTHMGFADTEQFAVAYHLCQERSREVEEGIKVGNN